MHTNKFKQNYYYYYYYYVDMLILLRVDILKITCSSPLHLMQHCGLSVRQIREALASEACDLCWNCWIFLHNVATCASRFHICSLSSCQERKNKKGRGSLDDSIQVDKMEKIGQLASSQSHKNKTELLSLPTAKHSVAIPTRVLMFFFFFF